MSTGTRIITLIDNVSMGNGHIGLALIAKKHAKIKVEELGPGEIVMFLNKAKDKLKIIGHKGVVMGYLRQPHGKRIMLEAIQFIPQTFGGSGAIHYDRALEEALTKRLQRDGSRRPSPLQVVRAMERAGV